MMADKEVTGQESTLQWTQDMYAGHIKQISDLCHTKQWLDNEMMHHQVALQSAEDIHGNGGNVGTDPGVVFDRITQLQHNLSELSTKDELREMITHRLQLSTSLLHALHSPSAVVAEAGDQEDHTQLQKELLLQMVEKQTEVVSQVLSLYKEILHLEPSLEMIKIKNIELKESNRQMMAELKHIQRTQQDTVKAACDTQKVKEGENRLQRSKAKAEVARQIFQGIALATGENWAQENQLRDLILGLGQPLHTQL